MTVNELLAKLSAAFGLFNNQALDVWTPVYIAALKPYEGAVLAATFKDTMQAFEPSPRKAYPLPKDFVAFLPSHPLKGMGEAVKPEDAPIREHMDRRRAQAPALYDEWLAVQGQKVILNRGQLIGDACKSLARDKANKFGWLQNPPKLRLTLDEIELCVERVVSRQRVAMFGPIPKSAAVWKEQMAAARDAINAPVGRKAA